MNLLSLLFSPIKEFWKKGDVILLGLCLATSTFGLALIYSATQYQQSIKPVIIQAIAILLGVVAYVLLTFVDFQLFTEKRWKLMLIGSLLLLLLLLSPWGVERYGNRNWIQIPHFPMMIQPNEIVKIPFILVLALQIIKIQDRGYSISSVPSVMQIAGFTVFMLGLIAAICHDMGTCAVYIMIFAFMAWAAGVKLRWFVLVGGGAVLAVVIFWLFFLPETSLWTNFRIMRFRVVLDHSLDPSNYGFQQTRSTLAIGSGKLFGQGYLKGIQTHSPNSSALPVRDSDLIFAVCGEELGFVGCMALLLLLSGVVLRCIWVGRHASSPFSAYVCMGMAGMLLSQITFNVGMCLYVLPVMGLMLPFVDGAVAVAGAYVSSVKARPMPSWLRDRSQV